MVSVMWAYDGWSDVGFVSGEVRDPQRNLPRAFVLGTLAVGCSISRANAAYLVVIPLRADAGLDADRRRRGRRGGRARPASCSCRRRSCVSTFGTLNGSMMTGPAGVLRDGRADGLFFRALARVDPRYGTPGRAIALERRCSASCSSRCAASPSSPISSSSGSGRSTPSAWRRCSCCAARQPDRERPYRTWGYPWVPALFLVATLFLLGAYLVTEPAKFAACFGVIALGVAGLLSRWSAQVDVAGVIALDPLAQSRLLDLAHRVARQLVDEHELARASCSRRARCGSAPRARSRVGAVAARGTTTATTRSPHFASAQPITATSATAGCVAQHVLDLRGGDLEAAALDDVGAEPPDDPHVAVADPRARRRRCGTSRRRTRPRSPAGAFQ